MKINDLNEKFEDFEKENISSVFQGLTKITGIVVLAVFLVLFNNTVCYNEYYIS